MSDSSSTTMIRASCVTLRSDAGPDEAMAIRSRTFAISVPDVTIVKTRLYARAAFTAANRSVTQSACAPTASGHGAKK